MEIGKVTGAEYRINKDGKKAVLLLQVRLSDEEDIQTVQLVSQSGEESHPPVKAGVVVLPVTNSFKVAVASDDLIEKVTAKGEKRLYSTDSEGTGVKTEVHLKNDGTVKVIADNINVTANNKITYECNEFDIKANTFSVLGKDSENATMLFTGDLTHTGEYIHEGAITQTGNVVFTGDFTQTGISQFTGNITLVGNIETTGIIAGTIVYNGANSNAHRHEISPGVYTGPPAI